MAVFMWQFAYLPGSPTVFSPEFSFQPETRGLYMNTWDNFYFH